MINIENGRYWDLPWSLISGCTPCSQGCDHCWSAAMTYRFAKRLIGQTGEPLVDSSGNFTGCIAINQDRLSIPMKRRKPTVYAVWNDLFHEDVPYQFIWDTQRIAAQCPQHTFLVLTKRPQRMAKFCKWVEREGRIGAPKAEIATFWNRYSFPDNWWSGLTVCNEYEATEKIPVFLQVPGKKFLSIEPMLSELSLRWIVPSREWYLEKSARNGRVRQYDGLRELSAVILGGETGPGARPMHSDWARLIRNQCAAAGVPFFFKQWGEWYSVTRDLKFRGRMMNDPQWHIWPDEGFESTVSRRIGCKKAGRTLDGRTHDGLPWVAP